MVRRKKNQGAIEDARYCCRTRVEIQDLIYRYRARKGIPHNKTNNTGESRVKDEKKISNIESVCE